MPKISKTQFILIAAFISLSAAAFAFALSTDSSDSLAFVVEDPSDYYFLQLGHEDYTTYTDPVYGFSFSIPKDFAVSSFFDDESNSYVALFEHSDPNFGIQVIVSPAHQDTPLTFEDISPSVPVEHPVVTELSDGTPILRFYSKTADGKRTGEIWFIRDGNLYQFSMSGGYVAVDGRVQGFAQDITFADE